MELFTQYSGSNVYVDMVLPLHIQGYFTYEIPRELMGFEAIGKRAIVPLKSKLYTGLIVKIHNNRPELYVPKLVEDILDQHPIISNWQFEFWLWAAQYYLCYMGDIMQAALPSALKLSSETYIGLHPNFSFDQQELTDKEYLITEALSIKHQLPTKEIQKILSSRAIFKTLKSMVDKNIIVASEELTYKYKTKKEAFLRLNPELDNDIALNELFDRLEKLAPKQLDALMLFISIRKKRDWVPRKEILNNKNIQADKLKALEQKGILEHEERIVDWINDGHKLSSFVPVSLSSPQLKAYNEIKHAWMSKEIVLLHGVTSSGKTMIYTQLIEETLAQGKQVLYLVPEIGLTTQLILRLKHFFKNKIGVYHSRFNDSERAEIWQKVADGTYDIVLGVRSTVFMPFHNLGLVIIDEEHDTSFKQNEPAPRYNAKVLAMKLASICGAKTLLGSATPAIESYHLAKNGTYGLVMLNERYGGVQMPVIHLSDSLLEAKNETMKGFFTSEMYNAIKNTLLAKEQVILFQNRRGYVPIHECISCGYVPQCKNCDISLNYHKSSHHLVCHYCDYKISLISKCPACMGTTFQTRGFGTEKVEEELNLHFPTAIVTRLDQDVTRAKNAFTRIIKDFEDRKIDILIGTQMVTKGLDFENVSLVGVLNADQSLNYPDFRSTEKTFQLLAQVSGRSGRKQKQGLVVVQTKKPHHKVLQWVKENNYQAFFENEVLERQNYNYPPYSRIIMIDIKHKDYNRAMLAAQSLVALLQSKMGSMVQGPATPLIPRIRNLFIQEILIKIPKDKSNLALIKTFIAQSIEKIQGYDNFKSVHIMPDVDPS